MNTIKRNALNQLKQRFQHCKLALSKSVPNTRAHAYWSMELATARYTMMRILTRKMNTIDVDHFQVMEGMH